MDIKNKINKVMIEAKRCGFKFTHLVVGKKEYEEIKNMDTSWMTDEDRKVIKNIPNNEYTLKLIKTEDEECLQLCNMFDKEKEAEKLMNSMLEG